MDYFWLPVLINRGKHLVMFLALGFLLVNAQLTESKDAQKKFKKGYVIEVQSHNQAVKSANPIVDLEQSISEGISDPFADPKFIINKINEEFFGTELKNTMTAGSPAIETRLHSKELLAFRGLTNSADQNSVVQVGNNGIMPSNPMQQHAIKEHQVPMNPRLNLAQLRLRQRLLQQAPRMINPMPHIKSIDESALSSQLDALGLANAAMPKVAPMPMRVPAITRANLAPDLNSGLTNPALSNSLNPVTTPELLPGLRQPEAQQMDSDLIARTHPNIVPVPRPNLMPRMPPKMPRMPPKLPPPVLSMQQQVPKKLPEKLLHMPNPAPKIKEAPILPPEEEPGLDALSNGPPSPHQNKLPSGLTPHNLGNNAISHSQNANSYAQSLDSDTLKSALDSAGLSSHSLDGTALSRSMEGGTSSHQMDANNLSHELDGTALSQSIDGASISKSLDSASLTDGLKLDSTIDGSSIGSSSLPGATSSQNTGGASSSRDPISSKDLLGSKDIEDNYSSIKDFLDADNILRQKFKDGVDIAPPAKADNSPLADLLHKKHTVPSREIGRLFRRVLSASQDTKNKETPGENNRKKVSWHRRL